MDVQRILPAYHRMRLREYLNGGARPDIARRTARPNDVLFADIYTADRAGGNTPAAPQGVGEAKHGALDQLRPGPISDQNTGAVDQMQPRTDTWDAGSSFRYVVAGVYMPAANVRTQMEAQVRKAKKAGLQCPHLGRDRQCTATYIRCGDRHQFALRETPRDRGKPHACRYQAGRLGEYVLIADDDRSTREFCKNTFEIFFNYDPEKVLTAGSGKESLDILQHCKVNDLRCGLVVVDSDMPGMSGFELINELYDRNHNVEVLLLQDRAVRAPRPDNYAGDREILPHERFVGQVLRKPFHSEAFIEKIRTLGVPLPDRTGQ